MVEWAKHYKNANWPMVYYLTIIHTLTIYSLWYFVHTKWQTLVLAFVMANLSGIGITGGAHRLWSHKSFKAHWTVRLFFMLCNSMANQGTIYHWSRDHRVHHKFSETEADPHNAMRGLFFAHIGWLLVKKDPKVIEAGRKLNCNDLLEDWTVRYQKYCNPWIQLFMCFAFPTMISMYYWQEDCLTAFLIAGVFKYTFVLHSTWLVNSVAHFYGDTPYDPTIHPTENLFVSIFAMGEGWHNFHHTFPYDYATSEFGISTQYNPTKMLIDGLAKIGLITDRKRALHAWEQKKLKMALLQQQQQDNKDATIAHGTSAGNTTETSNVIKAKIA